MKIVFLDVDGVLHPADESDKEKMFLPQPMECLCEILNKSGAELILHSGWKNMFSDRMLPVMPQAQPLVAALKKYRIRLDGMTPNFATETILLQKTFSKIKAREITAYLAEEKRADGFVVLEDLDLGDPFIASHQVVPSSKNGLTREDAAAALKLLSLPFSIDR
jgi:hypothetical protein